MSVQKIALLGTGLMGAPMAQNLCQAGWDTTVWNRTAAKAEPLATFGAKISLAAADAVASVDIVISMLSDGPTGNLVQKDPKLRAEEANLAIMAGGAAEDFATVRFAMGALGTPVHVGPVGAGQLAKLANQAIVAITIAAVAEAMLMLQKGGADPAAVRAALKGGFADSIILQQHGARMTDGNFIPGGLSELQLKDLENALAEAESFGITLPTLVNTRDRFRRLVNDLGGAKLDHSALYLELCDQNGLDVL